MGSSNSLRVNQENEKVLNAVVDMTPIGEKHDGFRRIQEEEEKCECKDAEDKESCMESCKEEWCEENEGDDCYKLKCTEVCESCKGKDSKDDENCMDCKEAIETC